MANRSYSAKWLALLLLSAPTWAATYNAASCSLANVNTAIASASTGDTVVVPSCGSTTWASTLTLTKAITLQGQTSCTGKGATLACTSNTTIHGSGIAVIDINVSNARVTGFTLTGGANGSGVITTESNITGWRIDHCRITAATGGTARGAYSFGGSGLYDHIYMDTADGGIDVEGQDSRDTTLSGDYNWSRALGMGTSDAVFVEDSRFEFTSPLDGAYDLYNGAKVVFRFNYVHNTNIGSHGLDSSAGRSTLFEEWSNNTFLNDSGSNIWTVWNSRGGTHLGYGNTVTGTGGTPWSVFVDEREYRQSNAYSWGNGAVCEGSNWLDGNTSGQHGYPCRDQVGRGPETAPSTDWTVRNSASPAPAYSEALYPGYFFANHFNGSTPTVASNFNVSNSNNDGEPNDVSTYQIVNNRDFYNEDSTHCSSGGCTQGVGIGTLASRPSTCTAGVSWWATDQGTWNQSGGGGQGLLYACRATNTWALYYTPYTYPHPLQGTGTPSASAPSCTPPSGTVPQTVSCTDPNGGTHIMCWAASPTSPVTPATNGSGTGCTTGTQYTAPISMTSAETLNVVAGVAGDLDSPMVSYTYTAATGSGGGSCSTTFPATQNPLVTSDNCAWVEGGTTGLDWNNMQTTTNFAGGVGPANTSFADPTAILAGTWGPKQTAQATVYVSSPNASYYQEVELRLRSAIVAHSNTGYELDYAVTGAAGSYLQIVRWNGALADFTYLGSWCSYPTVCGQVSGISVGNGDVVKGTINGNVISAYINGTLIAQATDSTYTGGAPGIGVDYGCGATYANFGFSAFSASDGGVLPAVKLGNVKLQGGVKLQ